MTLPPPCGRPLAEGAGGTAIAAALSGRAGTGKVVAVVSGGNIDLSRFSELVCAHAAH
jgi:threonine dehydratase